MNKKGKDFIFYKKKKKKKEKKEGTIYAFSRPSWSIAHGHGVCTQSVPASTLALDQHEHTYCILPAA